MRPKAVRMSAIIASDPARATHPWMKLDPFMVPRPLEMSYRFPSKQPRSVSARIPVPSNAISARSPPPSKYAVQNARTASFRCAASGALSGFSGTSGGVLGARHHP
jgi:hypothetical protein